MTGANDTAHGHGVSEEVMVAAAKGSGLSREHESDPTLRTFYMRKLLKRGWAGDRSPTERKYCSLVHRAEGKYLHNAAHLHGKHVPEGVRAQTRLLTRPATGRRP